MNTSLTKEFVADWRMDRLIVDIHRIFRLGYRFCLWNEDEANIEGVIKDPYCIIIHYPIHEDGQSFIKFFQKQEEAIQEADLLEKHFGINCMAAHIDKNGVLTSLSTTPA